MFIVLFCAAVAAAVWFPDTAVGAVLKRLLIERPARILNAVRRGHVATAVVVVGALGLAYAFGKNEGLLAASQASGDVIAYLAAGDLISSIDVLAIGLLIAATVRFREAIGPAAARARQWAGGLGGSMARVARSRARRIRSGARRPRGGEDSDRPAPGLAWA
jgi:hypothetical protein